MFITKVFVPRILVAAALVTAAGGAMAIADECKAVDISVDNGKTVKIKTIKVEYACQYDNTARSEQIPNVEVAAGASKLVAPNQNLAGCEGHKMLWMKLHFQAFCGGKWSKEFVSQEDKSFLNDAPCGKGRKYTVTVPSSSTSICDQIK